MAEVSEFVELAPRKTLGKGLGGLRNLGMIPAVIHNHGAPSIHVEAPEAELIKIYKQAGKHQPLQLKVGGKEYLALIKDVHYNPVKRRMQHVVFQAIKQNEKVEAQVPIRLEGEIPAEKAGLIVLRQLDEVEVEALPKDLPDELVVDATKLIELHDKLTVADLGVPSGVSVLTEADHPIATVAEPRAVAAEEAIEEAEEGEAGEAAEGEGEAAAEGEAPAADTEPADK